MPGGAWNNWYHCMGNTYGTWVPGDPRGFRTHRHRQHIDGDYTRPPPAHSYDLWLAWARSLMPRDAVLISPTLRPIVCRAFALRLLELRVEVVDLCVTAMHFHLLARFTPLGVRVAAGGVPNPAAPGLCAENGLRDGRDPMPRHCCGIAKKHTSFVAREHGVTGGLWGKGCHVVPVRDRQHQLNVVRYIRDHVDEGAAVWSMIREQTGGKE